MAAVHPSQDTEERLRALRTAQARLRALIDNEPECVKLLDADGRLLEMNAAGLRMIEADAGEQVLGKCVYGIVAPEHVEAFRDLTERVCRGERGILEFELVGLKGTRRWMETHAAPFRDDASGETRLLGITRDITDRRRAEQALRESEQRFQLFMDNLPASAWIRDAQFRYTYVNRLYAKAWGVEPQALVGREAAEFFPAAVAQYFRETDRKVQRDGAPLQFVDGLPSGRWLQVKFPVPDGAGGIGVGGIAVDVTERSRLEEALRESERRFRSFMDNAPAVAWIKDANFRYTYVNRTHRRVFGRGAEKMLGRDDFEIHSESVARELRQHDEAALEAGEGSIQTVETVPYADTTLGHWLVVKFPLADTSGKTGVAGIAVDITERKQAEETLQAMLEGTASVTGERFFPALVRAVARAAKVRCAFVTELLSGVPPRLQMLAIWVGDRLADPVEYDLAHTPCELVIKQGEACYPDSVQELFPQDRDLAALGAASYLGMAMADASGKTIGHLCILDDKPLVDGQRIASLLKIFVSRAAAELERTKAEDALRKSRSEIRGLLDRLVSMQESERRRVADELHDLIGQNLTALGIDLQALKQRLQSGGDLICGPRIDAMAALVETTIDAIRGVMTDLRPVALEEFGLLPALRSYASVFSKRTGIKVSASVSGRELRLPRDTELALFRIVQEALTNAAKHSGGTAVDIAVRYGEGLRLTVQDDGGGFAEPVGASGARRGGFGLPTMRERAEAHGGTVRIEFPGRGTRLVVDMPGQGHGD